MVASSRPNAIRAFVDEFRLIADEVAANTTAARPAPLQRSGCLNRGSPNLDSKQYCDVPRACVDEPGWVSAFPDAETYVPRACGDEGQEKNPSSSKVDVPRACGDEPPSKQIA